MALGPIRFHEVAVLLLFILLVFLWLFRDPMFARGWATYFGVIKPKDATAVMIPVILLFMIPSRPREGFRGPVLLTWKMVQAKLQWSVILLIGSGFAIAEAMRVSGLCRACQSSLGLKLAELGHLSPGPLMICLSIICSFMSELISNCGTCTCPFARLRCAGRGLEPEPLAVHDSDDDCKQLRLHAASGDAGERYGLRTRSAHNNGDGMPSGY
ncbi:hypothetical protein MRX96_016614 [Rhipicephalus microplus]